MPRTLSVVFAFSAACVFSVQTAGAITLGLAPQEGADRISGVDLTMNDQPYSTDEHVSRPTQISFRNVDVSWVAEENIGALPEPDPLFEDRVSLDDDGIRLLIFSTQTRSNVLTVPVQFCPPGKRC